MDVAIINRLFWPEGQVIGEALLQLSEKLSECYSVCVITQSEQGNLSAQLRTLKRGKRVKFNDCKIRSSSASSLLLKGLDFLNFTAWTIVQLLINRPKKIYVATNPPIIIPVVVFLYCKLFKATYCYHLQDIHPEITNTVLTLPRVVFKFLRFLDVAVIKKATSIVTINTHMSRFISERSKTKLPIFLVNNPSFQIRERTEVEKIKGIVFCGNLGSLQLIPLIIESIEMYLREEGQLKFCFVGGGTYQKEVAKLAQKFDAVEYLGVVSAEDAEAIVSQYQWALLPIQSGISNYAFPSKSSSYVMAGCSILGICDTDSSLHQWVKEYNLGHVCAPEISEVVNAFYSIEHSKVMHKNDQSFKLLDELNISSFVSSLSKVIKDI